MSPKRLETLSSLEPSGNEIRVVRHAKVPDLENTYVCVTGQWCCGHTDQPAVVRQPSPSYPLLLSVGGGLYSAMWSCDTVGCVAFVCVVCVFSSLRFLRDENRSPSSAAHAATDLHRWERKDAG